jgi:hypothetical protein
MMSNHFRVFAGRNVNTFEINERFFLDKQIILPDLFQLWRRDVLQLRADPCEIAGTKIIFHFFGIS